MITEGFFSKNNVEIIRKSSEFIENEKYSDKFLFDNSKNMIEYGTKWATDPFHAWSRQFEYPWVTQQIKNYVSNIDYALTVMDAGSGYTYFPYYLSNKVLPKNSLVHAIDYDIWLKSFYDNTNDNSKHNIFFEHCDLSNISYESKFDIIYSISTLEHSASQLKENLNKLYTALKPGGCLILSMDVSRDGGTDIDIDIFKSIWMTIRSEWNKINPVQQDLLNLLPYDIENNDANVFTLATALNSYAIYEKWISKNYYQLSIFGAVFIKN